MADSVQEFFDALSSGVDESKTAGMNNSYLFDIEGAGQRVLLDYPGPAAQGPSDGTEGDGMGPKRAQ